MPRVLHDLLVNSAKRFPTKPAIFFKDGSLTYEQILRQSKRLGSILRENGIARSDRVAFYLEKRFKKVISIFGISMSGGVIVPVRRLLQPHQVAHIISNSGAKVLITTYARLASLQDHISDISSLRVVIALDKENDNELNVTNVKIIDWHEGAKNSSEEQIVETPVIETDMAAILYTSGSTGRPKGVVLSHLNIVAGAKKISEYLKINENDRLLSILTFGFDYGLNQLTSAFLHGAQLVLLDYLFIHDIIKAVEKYKITGLAAVAATWNQLLQASWHGDSIPSLRYITNTGGKIPENYVRELRRRLPNAAIYLMYGLTEAFRSTYLDPQLVDERPTSIGKAIPGEEILVLNEEGQPVKPGEVGELVHRGILVAQGYWNEPELTAVRFRANPLQPEEVPVRELVVFSGDQVRLDEEGFLYFVGRKDEMIKCAGNRVSPTEVEEVIYASKKIQDAIVMGIPDDIYGEVIKAIVVPRPSVNINEEELLRHCEKLLPPYMIPKSIEFRKELPRNANGKLDRAKVKKEILESLEADNSSMVLG